VLQLADTSVNIEFMAQLVRPFRGVSASDRIADRRARLIAAGLDVLGTDGFQNFTMTAVCRTAGLNEGTSTKASRTATS
jgi:AcrR family transcriptional regulator